MGTTGRSAIVPDDIPTAITTKHLATITLDRTLALPEYLATALHSDPVLLRQVAKPNRGAIMSGLNLTIIRGLELRVPPIDVQQKYAEALRRVRKLGDQQQESFQKADDLYDALAQRAFSGELFEKPETEQVAEVLDLQPTLFD